MWALDLSGEPYFSYVLGLKAKALDQYKWCKGFQGAITRRILVRLVRVDGLGIVIRLSSVKAYFYSLIS